MKNRISSEETSRHPKPPGEERHDYTQVVPSGCSPAVSALQGLQQDRWAILSETDRAGWEPQSPLCPDVPEKQVILSHKLILRIPCSLAFLWSGRAFCSPKCWLMVKASPSSPHLLITSFSTQGPPLFLSPRTDTDPQSYIILCYPPP